MGRRGALIALVVALLVGSTAAFALTEALKLERSQLALRRLDSTLTPGCRCPTRAVTIVLRLREAATIDAAIVDAEGDEVRVLAARRERPAGLVRFRWNGRSEDGAVAAAGDYRVRVSLREQERTIVIPKTIRLEDGADGAAAS